MWEMLRRLWAVSNPASIGYRTMSGPLLNADVWVAWDHQARLAGALADRQDFLAVPAPTGPAGQGYLTAVVDLAISKGAPNQRGAEALIDRLTRPAQQAAAAFSLSFFPAVDGVQLAGPRAPELDVDQAYRANRAALETLPPVGLGSDADAFTGVYQESFARIVLRGEDIAAVLADESARLQRIVSDAGAPCWRPDPPARGPCRIR
jgi:multiple sugar transport system substrate-binding protein